VTNPTAELLHTVPEAAALLRVSPGTVRSLYRSGQLRITRVGRLVRVPDSALRELLAPSTTAPAASPLPAERTHP
jgi:excisionase family DNA binding protein